MAKRIFRTIVLTVMLAVLLTTTLIVSALFNLYEKQVSDELRLESDHIVHALTVTDDVLNYLENICSKNRITLVDADGTVLFDNAADPANMVNHGERPEIRLAFQEGSGETKRISDTLSEMTLYYAVRTADGDVLRIASTRSSVLGIFMDVTHIIIGMLLTVVALSFIIARISTRFIVAPINSLDLDSPLENEA
ncbi:MAG: histidine kinase, partial [Clostridia bacterium]|nr:histidine kinase [Clostridia bacterium]